MNLKTLFDTSKYFYRNIISICKAISLLLLAEKTE